MSTIGNQIAKGLAFVVISIVGAFLTATVYLVAIQLSLPPTDLAYDRSLLKVWDDPFVRTIASTVAFFCGLLASPILYFCLRRRRLVVALPLVFGSVLVAVAAATPLNQLFGLFSGFAALVISCIICTRVFPCEQ
jgi:hypothetical protein